MKLTHEETIKALSCEIATLEQKVAHLQHRNAQLERKLNEIMNAASNDKRGAPTHPV